MAEVSNKQIVLRDYVSGSPKESDMIITSSIMKLKLPEGSKGVLLKNLYLSRDPSLQSRMRKHSSAVSYVETFKPSSPIIGYGVARVLDSGNPSFKEGDLVWGLIGWEQYSVVNTINILF